jgi:cytochrome c-type biogenesis protein CcmH
MKATQRLFVALLGAWLLLRLPVALAIDTTPPLPDPVLQQRYLGLTHELRCMQCQDESLADSPVGLASDLRRNVQEMLLAGASDEQIRDHMVARYGEFILFRPRMNWRNAWLWCAPAVLMLVGAIIAVRVLRERSRRVDQEETSDESLNA